MMDAFFKIWETNRNNYLRFIEPLTLEQLNKTPEGFNNNIIWNVGHIIVAQQSLVYRLSGLPMQVTDEMFNLYKPGTKPERAITQQEADELKQLLIALCEQTRKDVEKGIFTSFTGRMTATGFDLASFDDALEFNNYHEGLHLGMMMTIRKFI
ncbi:DinB family protein [Sediminibacterium sp.]|jgi:hypothetical protein|uniref:DinB family protein n=1 Tax=Sediminibacterium sp. TaxID=1917865 RepID=UPI0025CF423C|nr:DinB family protein [Sediminibacterium sp.]MBW0177079.1 DinB family protein [Sediminibacterium sp.]